MMDLNCFLAAFLTQTVVLEDSTVKFEIWDTAGQVCLHCFLCFVKDLYLFLLNLQERYHSLAPMYYRGAAAAVVVYDVSNRQSFVRAQNWVKELQRQGSANIVIALAGNKCDLPNHEVSKEEAMSYADENGIFYMETSAKVDTNVGELFVEIARRLPKENPQEADPSSIYLEEVSSSNSKGGCC